MISTFRQKLIEDLIAKHGGRCCYCKIEVRRNFIEREKFNHDATVDHIIPKSKGGPNNISNYALACRGCNQAKGDRSVEEFRADPRPAGVRSREERQRRHAQRGVRSVPVPAVTVRHERLLVAAEPKEKLIRGTLAWAIAQGEVTEHHTYVKPQQAKKKREPRPIKPIDLEALVSATRKTLASWEESRRKYIATPAAR